jgi:hypothetical protein
MRNNDEIRLRHQGWRSRAPRAVASWYRTLVTRKFDGSKARRSHGRLSAKVRSSSTTRNALLGSTGRCAWVTVTHLVGIEELLTGLVPSSQRYRLERQAVVEQIVWDDRLGRPAGLSAQPLQYGHEPYCCQVS